MSDYLPSPGRLLARIHPVLVRWGVLALHAELLADGAPRAASWTLLPDGLAAAPEEDCWAELVHAEGDRAHHYVLSAYAPGVGDPDTETLDRHLEGAPSWVGADPARRYSLIAWAQDGRWETAPQHSGRLDPRRPWTDPAIEPSLASLTSDEATVDALATLLWRSDAWSYDPARTWAAELLPLARVAWNAMVDPDIALDPGLLADHLVALSGHLRRTPVPRATAERTARLAYQLWGHLAGEAPLGLVSLNMPPAPYDTTRRTLERTDVLPVEQAAHVAAPARPDPADPELAQAIRHTLAWAVAALREAAAGTPRERRHRDLDEHGLVAYAPDGRIVRLTTLDPAHLVLSVHRPASAPAPGLFGRLFGRHSTPEPDATAGRPLPLTPGWVPVEEIRQAGGEILDLDWCVRGRWDYRRWSGDAAGGFGMPGASEALAGPDPVDPADLDPASLDPADLDALLAGLHPATSTALAEVTAMRAALDRFLAGAGPLALRGPEA